MLRASLTALLVSSVSALPLMAQESETSVEVEVSLGQQEGESAPADNPMSELMQNVKVTAGSLSETVATLSSRIDASAKSREEGVKMLDDMLEAARSVNESLDDDSEVWGELNTLLGTWNERRDGLSERVADNPGLKPVIDLWQDRIEEAKRLRTQILDQAATSRALVAQIESQREVVLAFYDVGAADAVLSAMQQMSDELGAMNDEMGSILSQAGIVAEAEGVAQN